MNGLHYPFTPRQREVLSLLADGVGPAEAAQRMGVKTNTIHRQVARMREALDCSYNRLIVFSVRWVDLQKGKL